MCTVGRIANVVKGAGASGVLPSALTLAGADTSSAPPTVDSIDCGMRDATLSAQRCGCALPDFLGPTVSRFEVATMSTVVRIKPTARIFAVVINVA